jgi:hypothetical protein
MGYEDCIRQGLKMAGICENPWIELLALHMLPDPSHDLSGNGRIWRFVCPNWMTVDVITGTVRKRHHVCRDVDFGQPGIADISGPRLMKWAVRLDQITGVVLTYQAPPDSPLRTNV